MPSRIKESGISDRQAELRWRWRKETESTPELYSYAEAGFMTQPHKPLIGSYGAYKLGLGVVKGFDWGTMTLRFEAE
jgi:hypothetical protein